MPRAKDTKVWNEDLVLAFAARGQQALADGKCSTIGWNKAAEIIQAVRKDIYKAKTGRYVAAGNLTMDPPTLFLTFSIQNLQPS